MALVDPLRRWMALLAAVAASKGINLPRTHLMVYCEASRNPTRIAPPQACLLRKLVA